MIRIKTPGFILIALSNFLSSTCFAQNRKDSLKVLFGGNSYTYSSNLPHLISSISVYQEFEVQDNQ